MNALARDAFLKLDTNGCLSEFLHDCVNRLCEGNSVQFNNTDNDKAEDKEFNLIRRVICNFYRQRIQESVPLPEGLPQHVTEAIETVFKIRYKDIVSLIVKEKLLAQGHLVLESFDWKLKWILGSSKLATIREPVCQIELICLNKGNNLVPRRTSINFECNLEQINGLISSLNSIRNNFNDNKN
ncbi:hypothetical protein ABEB36_005539 [Hypothenemus hampei]|uniref:COMM domain-containing protein n=1 Tax=Hypothenemus hampei TaxID=57062 RepID=A0ABD1EYK1_HYPHA